MTTTGVVALGVLALRDLQQFLVLAEELNFHRAAERLHLSQPTLSQTLQRLERVVGAKLIDRGGRKSILTEAGRLLADRSMLLLRDADSLVTDVRSVADGMRRQLRVGSVNPAMRALVPHVLRSLHGKFPDLRISLQPHSSFDLASRLREGRLDLAIARTGELIPGFTGEVLMNDPLVAVMSVRHPLAARARVAIRDLSDEPFVMAPRDRNPSFHDELVSWYRACGCVPSQIIEANGMHSQLALIAAGIGVTVQSLLYTDPGRDDLVFVPVEGRLRTPLQILYPSNDRSAVTREFVAAARARAEELIAALPDDS